MNLHAPKGIDVENWFIECYRKYKGHPLKILIGLYKACPCVGATNCYG